MLFPTVANIALIAFLILFIGAIILTFYFELRERKTEARKPRFRVIAGGKS